MSDSIKVLSEMVFAQQGHWNDIIFLYFYQQSYITFASFYDVYLFIDRNFNNSDVPLKIRLKEIKK